MIFARLKLTETSHFFFSPTSEEPANSRPCSPSRSSPPFRSPFSLSVGGLGPSTQKSSHRQASSTPSFLYLSPPLVFLLLIPLSPISRAIWFDRQYLSQTALPSPASPDSHKGALPSIVPSFFFIARPFPLSENCCFVFPALPPLHTTYGQGTTTQRAQQVSPSISPASTFSVFTGFFRAHGHPPKSCRRAPLPST